jgi:hypothetical protein
MPRIFSVPDNLVMADGTAITASSYQNGFEPSKIADPARGAKWRSGTGWTFGPDNNKFPVGNDAGWLLAHIAAGTYATPALAATALESALNLSGFNPRSTLACSLWLRADSVVVDADNLISQATDLSGNSRHAVQTTPANKLLLVPNAVDGRPAMYSSGASAKGLATTALMSAMLAATTGRGTVVVVFKQDSDDVATKRLWFAGSGGHLAQMYWSGTTHYHADAYDSADRDADKTAALGVDKWQTAWWEYDGTNISAYVSNADTAAAANTAMSGNMHTDILNAVFQLGSSAAWKGHIAEVIIFPTALTQTQRRGVTQYLEGQYPSLAANDTTTFESLGTFSVSSTDVANKFTIYNGGGGATQFLIPAATGVPSEDRLTAAYVDFGFAAVDRTGALGYIGASAAYQSRQWIKMDLGAAAEAVACASLDASVSATVIIQANSVDSWESPPFSQVLSAGVREILYSVFSVGQTYRYWRLLINDVSGVVSAQGYTELAVLFLGSYVSLSDFRAGYIDSYQDLSSRNYGPSGSLWSTENPQRDSYQMRWDGQTNTEKAAFVAMRPKTRLGLPFFMVFDETFDPGGWMYSEIVGEITTEQEEYDSWKCAFGVIEVVP